MAEKTEAVPETPARPRIAIRVIGGFVWEHDLSEDGFAAGPLRPHYKEGGPGWPEGGYPDPKDLPRLMAETSARTRAAK